MSNEQLEALETDERGVLRVKKDTYTVDEKLLVSSSYPNLMSRYVLHTVELVMVGLPENDFTTTVVKRDRKPQVRF